MWAEFRPHGVCRQNESLSGRPASLGQRPQPLLSLAICALLMNLSIAIGLNRGPSNLDNIYVLSTNLNGRGRYRSFLRRTLCIDPIQSDGQLGGCKSKVDFSERWTR